MKPLAWRLVLVPLLLAAPAAASDDEPLVSGKDAKALARVLSSLARKGRPREVEILGEVLQDLGAPEKQLRGLAKAKEKAEKAAKRPKDASKEAEKLGEFAARLADDLSKRDGAVRTELARAILRIDSENEAAHEVLGDVKADGLWQPSWMPELRDRRAEISTLLSRAMRLEIPMETGEVEEPLLHALFGRKASFAKGGGLYLTSCSWGPARLRRVAVQVARATQLSRWILGKGDLPDMAPMHVRIVETKEEYLRAVAYLKSKGMLDEFVIRVAERLSGIYDTKRRFVKEARLETTAMADIFHWIGRDQVDIIHRGFPQEALNVGHLNWVSLAVLGVPANDVLYLVETAVEGKGGGKTVAEDPIPARRRRMVRMAKGGMHGLRSWLAYLTRMGAAPRWSDGFLPDSGQIQGNVRVKCIYVAELLQESGKLAEIMRATMQVDRKNPAEAGAAIEKALGQPLDAFERRFRDWLLYEPGAPGLVQRLGGAVEKAAAPGSVEASRAAAILDGLRAKAVQSGEAPPHLMIDEDLGRGCQRHAHYLTLHEDLWGQWPGVHEQKVDSEGFTPEGNRGGLNSVIAFGCDGPKRAIDQWMGTFYHRLPLIHPGLIGIGWGIEQGIAVLDCGSLVDAEAEPVYAVWPPAKAKDVPLGFQPELPNPIPGEDQSAWGYPVTVQTTIGDLLIVLELALYEGASATGETVPCHFITPQAPLNPDLAPAAAWCLIPKARLKAQTTYCVGVIDRTPEARRPTWGWTFRTGRE